LPSIPPLQRGESTGGSSANPSLGPAMDNYTPRGVGLKAPFFKGGLWGFGISDSNPVLIPSHSLAAPLALFRRGIQNSLSISLFLYCEVTIRVYVISSDFFSLLTVIWKTCLSFWK